MDITASPEPSAGGRGGAGEWKMGSDSGVEMCPTATAATALST